MTHPRAPRPSLAGRLAAAGLFGLAMAAVAGFALDQVGQQTLASAYREFLLAGGWLKIPLALMALASAYGAVTGHGTGRPAAAALAVVLASAAFWVVVVPAVRVSRAPDTPRAKARAILKWSHQSPEDVLRLVALSRDPDPRIRELAVLGLGENTVVADIEHASPTRPSRWTQSRVRDSLGVRLREALAGDTAESVRAEAARALWKAPLTFSRQAAAAETLASMLDRSVATLAPERLMWLALDAAAGAPHPSLQAAAARFATAAPDSELALAARRAVSRQRSGGDRAHSGINTP